MYLTAQRVTEMDGPVHGINAFLYLHDSRRASEVFEETPDVEAVAEEPPGEPTETRLSLTPGGNRVLSFLDIVCDDGVSSDALADAFDSFEDYVPQDRSEYAFEHAETIDQIGLRLYLSPHGPLAPDSEYASLREALLQLLAAHRGDASHETLRIARHRDANTWRFRPLSPDLEPPGSPDSTAATTISIDDDTLEAFERHRGPLYPAVAEAIFDMHTDELLEHGGVEIVDADSEHLVWRGP